jgi:hypothetical protein
MGENGGGRSGKWTLDPRNSRSASWWGHAKSARSIAVRVFWWYDESAIYQNERVRQVKNATIAVPEPKSYITSEIFWGTARMQDLRIDDGTEWAMRSLTWRKERNGKSPLRNILPSVLYQMADGQWVSLASCHSLPYYGALPWSLTSCGKYSIWFLLSLSKLLWNC